MIGNVVFVENKGNGEIIKVRWVSFSKGLEMGYGEYIGNKGELGIEGEIRMEGE